MRVLVSGASGFVGRTLIERLAAHHEVWAVGRTPIQGMPTIKWVYWDLSAPPLAGTLPTPLDAVVHLAQSRDYKLFPEKALGIARVNVGATLELLDHARNAGAARFVLASSGGVYGGSNVPITEDASVHPPDFYLSTKLVAEVLASSYRSLFDVVALRLFFVYGKGQASDRFIAQLVRKVLTGEPVTLYGPDGIRVNPIHVDDVAAAFQRALDLVGTHVINVAGPEVLTLRRIVELIGQQVGRTAVFENRPADEYRNLIGSTSAMARSLGAPVVRFETRVSELCDDVSASQT